MALSQRPRGYRFGRFDVDRVTGDLRRDGVRVRLRGKPFDLLLLLLDAGGELVTRDEIHAKLWPGAAVDFEGSLNAAVKRLRDTLRDSADNPTYIETLPTRGYRFLMKVEPIGGPAGATEAPSANEARVVREAAEGRKERRRFVMGFTLGVSLIAVAAAVAVAMLGASRESPVHRLLVLPFENLSGDPEQAYFSDGLTEEMITQLGRLNPGALGVIGRTSAMRFRAEDDAIGRARRELDVDYVLEGAVRRDSSRVRVSAKLIEARGETQVWASTFDRDLRDVLALQHDLAAEIASALAIELIPRAAGGLGDEPAVDPRAFEATLRGQYHLAQQTGPGFRSAGDAFRAAIEIDSTYAPAWSGLATTWAMVGLYDFVRPREAFPNARRAIERALDLDPDLPEAHTVLGLIECTYDWNFDLAEQSLLRALELDPASAGTHQMYANLLSFSDRPETAMEHFDTARELDPLSLGLISDIGWHYFMWRDYRNAVRTLEEVLELDPHYLVAHDNLAWTYFQMGRYEDYIEHATRALELDGIHADDVRRFRKFFEDSGWRALRQRSAVNMAHAAEREYQSPYDIALEFAAIGNRDEGIRWLHEAVNEREVDAIIIHIDPRLDSLRVDPRFEEVASRVVPWRP